MSLLVAKFGGTSVGNAEAITRVIEITRTHQGAWAQIVIVVSAMSGVTDMLIQGARLAATGDQSAYVDLARKLREKHSTALAELIGETADAQEVSDQIEHLIREFELLCHSVYVLGEASLRALDAIASLGERMSVRLVAAALRKKGIRAESIDATEIIITSAHFGGAVPLQEQTRERTRSRLRPVLHDDIIPVVTGFIGATQSGATTTLERGGSDYSAAIIGAALDADEVMIYTDVDGVMTTDPRLVPNTRVIPVLSYAEMGELAYFGAKVLHPRAVRPIVERGIPMTIRNTFNADHPGTRILSQVQPNGHPIKAVTVIRNMSMITVAGRGMIGVPGIAARTFGAVASVGANILMISQASSEQSICFVIPTSSVPQVMGALEEGLSQELARRDIDQIISRNDVVIVTAVGTGMRETPGVASKVFGVLAAQHINVIAIAQGSSECSISLVTAALDSDTAIRALHELTL